MKDTAAEHFQPVDAIAKALWQEMEKLEPSDDAEEWEELGPRARDFYRLCVLRIVEDRDLINLALSSHNPITWRPEERK